MTSYASNYERFSQHIQQADGTNFLDHALKPGPGDRVLDFGCGTGNMLSDLARRVGPSGFVLGVDPDEDRIDAARQLNAQELPNVEVHVGSIDKAAEFAPYDVVISNHVMHWIDRKKQEDVLRGIYGSLKPGCLFGFKTIREVTGYIRAITASQYENSFDAFLSAIGWDCRPASDWEKCVKEVGFEIVLSVEEERNFFLSNSEALLTWWEATSVGYFNAASVMKDGEGAHERLLSKYGWKKDEPVPATAIMVDVVARKP